MNKYSKKLTSAFLIVLILVPSMFFVFPSRAHGGIAIPGVDAIAREISSAVRDRTVRFVMDRVTNETIRWIQGGGTPKFVDDPGAFLGDVGSRAIGAYLENNENFRFLCSPFRAQLQVMLPLLVMPPELGVAAGCTLQGAVANIEGFFNDFRAGDWGAFTQAAQPNNNFIGSLLIHSDNARLQAAERREASLQEMIMGEGFLGTGRCREVKDAARPPTKENCKDGQWETTTPASVVSETLNKALGTQLDFTANVQTALSAVLNMLINQITGRGLRFAANTGAPGPDMTIHRERLAGVVRPAHQGWTAVIRAKRESLGYVNENVNNLEGLKTKSCAIEGQAGATDEQKTVVDTELTNARNASTTISNEISALQTKIAEASSTLALIGEAIDARSLTNAADGTNAFKIKYIDDSTEKETWSQRAQSSAISQAEGLKALRDRYRNARNICDATPPPAT